MKLIVHKNVGFLKNIYGFHKPETVCGCDVTMLQLLVFVLQCRLPSINRHFGNNMLSSESHVSILCTSWHPHVYFKKKINKYVK